MNSSVKFFDPIVSVVDALAGSRRISFGAGAADGEAFEDSGDSSPPPPQPASNRTSTRGAAARRSMRARLSRPPPPRTGRPTGPAGGGGGLGAAGGRFSPAPARRRARESRSRPACLLDEA